MEVPVLSSSISGGPSIINILELMFPENLTKFVDVFLN